MAIAATSKVNLRKYEKEADGTVCKLWDEIREDGIAEGEARGEARGEIRGEAKGIVIMGEEFNLPKKDILNKLQDKMNVDLQQAEVYYDMFSRTSATV